MTFRYRIFSLDNAHDKCKTFAFIVNLLLHEMAEVVIHVFDVIINISDACCGRFYIDSIINGYQHTCMLKTCTTLYVC